MKLWLSVFIFILFSVAIIECDPPKPTKVFEVITTFKANWHKASHHCLWNGMRLASVLSEVENNQVKKQINDSMFFDNFWLGGTKLGNEPYYYWMGVAKPMNAYTDWKTDPNKNQYSQPCLQMVTDNGASMYWTVADCYGLNYFVCEKN